MPLTNTYPKKEIFQDPHLSKLEEILEKTPEEITLFFMREGSVLGSFKSSAFTKKAARRLVARSADTYLLPVIDGNSSYTQQELSESKVEAILRRLNFSGHYINNDLALMKLQLSAEGKLISLSKGESMIYHLQSLNNINPLGFPGAWMLYYTQEQGFFIQKVEPIKIIASCLVCPYGMMDELVERGAKMPLAEKRIVNTVQQKHRPSDCPEEKCNLFFSHNEHGKVYRDRYFSIHQDLDSTEHKIVVEGVPQQNPIIQIAKFIGPLRNPYYHYGKF